MGPLLQPTPELHLFQEASSLKLQDLNFGVTEHPTKHEEQVGTLRESQSPEPGAQKPKLLPEPNHKPYTLLSPVCPLATGAGLPNAAETVPVILQKSCKHRRNM